MGALVGLSLITKKVVDDAAFCFFCLSAEVTISEEGLFGISYQIWFFT